MCSRFRPSVTWATQERTVGMEEEPHSQNDRMSEVRSYKNKLPARRKHPGDLREHLGRVREMLQHHVGRDQVEGVVGKGEAATRRADAVSEIGMATQMGNDQIAADDPPGLMRHHSGRTAEPSSVEPGTGAQIEPAATGSDGGFQRAGVAILMILHHPSMRSVLHGGDRV
jgi:hypothetical protein